MKKHPTHKSAEGFTLIEMLIVIAIIGILASVAIPQYSQYKIRGYDAQTKQALKDMHLLCNAYWLDTSALQGCDLPKIEEPTYGFNQNADVVATLPSLPMDNFCASAKHNDSPNTYSIDSASLISSGSGCSGAGGASTINTDPGRPIMNRCSVCAENTIGVMCWNNTESWCVGCEVATEIEGCDSPLGCVEFRVSETQCRDPSEACRKVATGAVLGYVGEGVDDRARRRLTLDGRERDGFGSGKWDESYGCPAECQFPGPGGNYGPAIECSCRPTFIEQIHPECENPVRRRLPTYDDFDHEGKSKQELCDTGNFRLNCPDGVWSEETRVQVMKE